MSFTGISDLSFADGYYHINSGGFGVVTFEDNTPDSIKERFWKERPWFREKVIEMQTKGIYSSKYPVLPFDDPEENKRNYDVKTEHLYNKT